jgi:cytochrome b6
VLRVKHDETPRSRALGVLSNVFLHLHPAKINRDAVAYNYTWGMGGMTFYVYITLVFTGTLLMFYYHPSKVVAFRDILYLEHDVPFGKLLRNMHRWGAHLMVIMVELHMFRVFLTGSYKKPRQFNWVVGVLLLVLTCCSASPATCCPTISSASGRSRWEPTWRAPRRCWATTVPSATCWE